MLRIIQKRNWLFLFSGLVLIPGLIYLGLFGLKLGIDFTGGTSLTVTFAAARPSGPEVASKISGLGYGQATAQTAGNQDMVIRLPSISNDQRQSVIDNLSNSYAGLKEKSYDSIGPTIGQEMFRRALSAIALVLIAIIAYISWAFRKVNVGPVAPWVYGLSAIIALVHDILIVIGIFAILGHYFDLEIDALFVTALLTVLGFSVHDTIVVFDRIRERLLQSHDESYEDTVNVSLNQTMVRSLATSFTTLLVLASLYLFGGFTIRNFTLALLIGIASGTYSSIFVASPLLVVYNNWKQKRQR